jgi:hypothetical protein
MRILIACAALCLLAFGLAILGDRLAGRGK